MAVRIETCTGAQVAAHLDDLARLRIAVFRDYPYLYDGDAAYERDYLATYARSPGSVFVLARDGDTVVGAATGIPLAEEGEAFRRPFLARGCLLAEVYYFGESVLLPAYRGQGIGHRFFDGREAQARRLGCRLAAFCAVERADDDPRRPADYRPHDAFWRKRGYRRQEAMFCTLDWKERGDDAASGHRLRFWLRRLDGRGDAVSTSR
ncbi:GNAT family acetyltransferase [Frateuria sp. Soil773]|uniref:GNAT family N-acetyltransferase n=1 Tax=Frateuria sp. Soil773 TaxID=1736407 RepID=UPI0006FAB090|nr:GNAT family N-acetyltransferase [Frateuria sp. Soil773]KRE89306.1 GNAT family acetyltransferase [Frateuria sp. Soil773]